MASSVDAVTGVGAQSADERAGVQLFGPVAVTAGGRDLDLGSPKQRALFVSLAMHAGEVVSSDRLVEMLWGDAAPRTAVHSVQIYVSGLRKSLQDVDGALVIETVPPGYRMALTGDALDTRQFAELVTEGRARLRAGASAEALAHWQAALTLWRGEPLAEFTYDDFAQPHIRRLHGLRQEALEGTVTAHLALGESAEAARIAEAVLVDDPTNERAVGLLMTAQYCAGRQVEALRTYRRSREALVALGLVPSPSLDHLHERILLHDPTLVSGQPRSQVGRPIRNPYKGLRAFGEHDAADYFGRESLVGELLERVRRGRRLIAVVGPSGCGKSSAVAAGLVPRLRAGHVPGSEHWLVATLVPGALPIQETTAAIARAAGTPATHLAGIEFPKLRAVARGQHVLLVIDQFESLFMAADESVRSHYLDALVAAIDDPTGRLTVVITLRADHYDQPLLHPRFAARFTTNVINVLPMHAAELTAAVTGPADVAGIDVESDFVAAAVADTVGQPGSLPLLQYAMAEQVDAFGGHALTIDDYRQLGGIRGALSRRAEDLFVGLGDTRQGVAKQLLLRMVSVGHGVSDACRRVTMSELAQLDLDPLAMSDVLEGLVRHRLVTVGRDPITDGPMVGLAHEALLEEWRRLAEWVEQYRTRLRRYEALRAAHAEWEHADRDDDALLTGALLRDAQGWRHDSSPPLTTAERAFIDASVDRHRREEAAEASRMDGQRRLERRARRRLLALAVVSLLLVSTLIVAAARIDGGGEPPRVTLFGHENSVVSRLIEDGFDRAVSDYDLRPARVAAMNPDSAFDLSIAAADQDVVVELTLATDVESVARAHPDTTFVVFDRPLGGDNITSLSFAANEGSYLAGAAAALTSRTGTIGFIGGLDTELIWEFHAGFEAGARAVDPGVRILAEYLGGPTDFDIGFVSPPHGERAATRMYDQGADVVFAAAGASGLGALEAAAAMSGDGEHLWVIGVDIDQYASIYDLPGVVDADSWRPHILTSMIKDYSQAVHDVLGTIAGGGPVPPSVRLGLAEGGVDLVYSGGFIDHLRPRIDELRAAIIDGDVAIPCRPAARAVTDAQPSTCAPRDS